MIGQVPGAMEIKSNLKELFTIQKIESTGWDCDSGSVSCYPKSDLEVGESTITVSFSVASFLEEKPIICEDLKHGEQVTEQVTFEKNAITYDGIKYDLSCKDQFTDGTSDKEDEGYGPKDADSYNLNFFHINRFNSWKITETCTQLINEFTLRNMATLSYNADGVYQSLGKTAFLRVVGKSGVSSYGSNVFTSNKKQAYITT
eukprot:15354656-Ditylum_brightwellii.AAC.1